MKLDREALRRARKSGGALAVIAKCNLLGYVRGRFENGVDVIATPDAQDWVMFPPYTMREADRVIRQMDFMPVVDMGR